MIEYVEIRDTSRNLIGIIDTAKSVIWKSVYYGTGVFEIYVQATEETVDLLKEDYYVTRPDNPECGIIEIIEKINNDQDGEMIIASGRFIKSIFYRRIIYDATLQGSGADYYWSCKSTILKGNVEAAVRNLIYLNAINASDSNRNISEVHWTDDDISNLSETITILTENNEEEAEKQVTYKNLLDYTDLVLKEYNLGSKMWLDYELLKFRFKVYKGVDRSRDTSESGVVPIIFSKEFDNLTSSEYLIDKSNYKNSAVVGGEGEGTERICAMVNSWISGLDRREVFVDASGITKDGSEIVQYRSQLESHGKQSISELKVIETMKGNIDLTNSNHVLGVDYNVGDIVTVEDDVIKKYMNTRILSVTEIQDDDGYRIDGEYGV